MIIFWVSIIVGLVVLFQIKNNRTDSGDSTAGKAIDILSERYARGEINVEEFESMKRDLRN